MTPVSLSDSSAASNNTVRTIAALQNIGEAISTYTYRTMALSQVRDYTQHLSGRIKTIIDAAISDPQQNKAVKNLVHDALWTEHYEAVRAWAEVEANDAMQPANSPQATHPFPFTTDHQLPVSV